MGHKCCGKNKVKRGLWSPEEDEKLIKHLATYGHVCWSSVPKLAGLERCGKSCRLRWINYLRPDVKRGSFTEQEERIIIDVHRILGNRWAQIAKHLPGRTDNEVKNFWNSSIKKKLLAKGLDPNTHNLLSPTSRKNINKSHSLYNFTLQTSLPPINKNQNQYQKPVMGYGTTNSNNVSSSASSSSSSLINPTGWGTGNIGGVGGFEPGFGPDRFVHQPVNNNTEFISSTVHNMEMMNTFDDSSDFDFDFADDSALMSLGVFCDVNSINELLNSPSIFIS